MRRRSPFLVYSLALLLVLTAAGCKRATEAAAPIASRRQNCQALASDLADFALWPIENPTFAPLAFPILVQDAGDAVRALAEDRIWAPRHWAELPSDPSEFPDAAWLSRHCLSLPLDQRYGAEDMQRVSAAVKRLLRPASRR